MRHAKDGEVDRSAPWVYEAVAPDWVSELAEEVPDHRRLRGLDLDPDDQYFPSEDEYEEEPPRPVDGYARFGGPRDGFGRPPARPAIPAVPIDESRSSGRRSGVDRSSYRQPDPALPAQADRAGVSARSADTGYAALRDDIDRLYRPDRGPADELAARRRRRTGPDADVEVSERDGDDPAGSNPPGIGPATGRARVPRPADSNPVDHLDAATYDQANGNPWVDRFLDGEVLDGEVLHSETLDTPRRPYPAIGRASVPVTHRTAAPPSEATPAAHRVDPEPQDAAPLGQSRSTTDPAAPRVISSAPPPIVPRILSRSTPPVTPRVISRSAPPPTPRVIGADPPTPPAAHPIRPQAESVPVDRLTSTDETDRPDATEPRPAHVQDGGAHIIAFRPRRSVADPQEPAATPVVPAEQTAEPTVRWRLDGATLREVADDRDELRAIGARLDEPLSASGDNLSRAQLLCLRAEVFRLLDQLAMAAAASRLALSHAEAAADAQAVVIAQAELAHGLRLRGDHAEADRLFEEAACADVPELLRSLVHENAGRCCFDQGRYLEALDHFARAIRLGDPADLDLVERIEVSLEAIYLRILRDGWGPYPRTREEILGAGGPAQLPVTATEPDVGKQPAPAPSPVQVPQQTPPAPAQPASDSAAPA